MTRVLDESRPSEGENEPLFSLGDAPLDRMPAIAVLFENAARACQDNLSAHMQESIGIGYERLEARRVADCGAGYSDDSRVFIFASRELKANAAVLFGNTLADIMLENILGSGIFDKAEEATRVPTRLETRLIEFVVEKIFEGLSSALKPLANVQFVPDPAASEQHRLAALGQKASVLILAYFRLSFRELEYEFVIALPRAALDPFRPALSRMPGVEGRLDDTRWSDDLYQHIVRTEVRIDVRIEARGFTLEDISQLEVGDLLRLPVAPTGLIRVETEGRTLFWCTLGQRDGYFTVRLEDFSDARQSFIENILGV